MSYRYVDRIFSITDTSAVATKLVTRQELYWVWFDFCKYINPIVIVESLIQLTEWWSIINSNYTKVSIPVYVKEISFDELVSFGDRLDLSLVSRGETKVELLATRDGQNVCSFEMEYKLEDLSSKYDLFMKRAQYKNLYRPELVDDEKISSFIRYKELSKNTSHIGYDFIDTVDKLEDTKVSCSMNLAACMYYFDERLDKSAPIGPVLMCGMEGASFLNQGSFSNKRIDMKLIKILDLKIDTLFKQGITLRLNVEKNVNLWSIKTLDSCSKNNYGISCNMIFE